MRIGIDARELVGHATGVGRYLAGLDPNRKFQLRGRCHELIPNEPFVVTGRAWAAKGVA